MNVTMDTLVQTVAFLLALDCFPTVLRYVLLSDLASHQTHVSVLKDVQAKNVS